jgi:hypothetical protein
MTSFFATIIITGCTNVGEDNVSQVNKNYHKGEEQSKEKQSIEANVIDNETYNNWLLNDDPRGIFGTVTK